MSEKEIIEAIRILGRYVVDSLPGGIFVLTPLEDGEIINTEESHKQCKSFFRKKKSWFILITSAEHRTYRAITGEKWWRKNAVIPFNAVPLCAVFLLVCRTMAVRYEQIQNQGWKAPSEPRSCAGLHRMPEPQLRRITCWNPSLQLWYWLVCPRW